MIPDWMPLEAWEAYLSMRKAMGKKYVATEYAKSIMIKKLDKWRLEGYDIEEIINNSIMHSYTGLFLPREMKKKDVEWWSSDELTIKKGRELHMQPKSGESMAQFRKRINTVIEHGGIENLAQSRMFEHEPVKQQPTTKSVAQNEIAKALEISRNRSRLN